MADIFASKVTYFNLYFLSLAYFAKLRYVKSWPAWQCSVRMHRIPKLYKS